MTAYLLEHAWVDGAVADTVRVEIAGGRFTSVEVDSDRPGIPLRGLTLPGFANTHSHAFHRALRGRTQAGAADAPDGRPGSFWSWREQMYAAAGRLDPDSYYQLARATYAEMVTAGHTSIGEFHSLHHRPDGGAYDDPNAMGAALIAAARDAGLRITLLDTLYLSSGFGAEPVGVQRRFSDGSAEAWRERVDALGDGEGVRVGVAAHSVRAVPAPALAAVASYAAAGRPVHVHLSEQVQENADCLRAHGVTPTRLLADHGVLGPTTTAVHATHLTDDDIALLGAARAYASFCPTTERDLGDGIGPSRQLRAAGARLTLGSDSHAVIDPYEEMRALELDERLATQQRGHWGAAELLHAATVDGHESLGFADAGQIAVGFRADLVTLDLNSPRTAATGGGAETAVFAAGPADVRQVIADGRVVYAGDQAAVGRELAEAIERIWS